MGLIIAYGIDSVLSFYIMPNTEIICFRNRLILQLHQSFTVVESIQPNQETLLPYHAVL